MKRIYYLFQGTLPARRISEDLVAAGMSVGQLHLNQQVLLFVWALFVSYMK